MQCFVFRSTKKEGLYVYLKDRDTLDRLPEAVKQQLGQPEFALEFDLTPTRKLGYEDPAEVLTNLESQGFHLQMPKEDVEAILDRIANPRAE
ncbi:MAG: YcgL domain-containing protein [Gammaproteobacteria bacterium]|nr:YcgL domain-containing protein [Gammaproteobacteria bacterium]